MNPERDNDRAADDRMGALLQEKKRIEGEITELKARKEKSNTKLGAKKSIFSFSNFIVLIVVVGVVGLPIFIFAVVNQPEDAFSRSGVIKKVKVATRPPCKPKKDNSDKLYIPEDCASSSEEENYLIYTISFIDNAGENKTIVAEDDETIQYWPDKLSSLTPSDVRYGPKNGTWRVLNGRAHWRKIDISTPYPYCGDKNCTVTVYYYKKRWFGTSEIYWPIIELHDKELPENTQ